MNNTYTKSSAKISDCEKYRYELVREWTRSSLAPNAAQEGQVVFCLLNPSRADAAKDDRTIKRCVGFAQNWGYSRIVVVNLYAYRTPYPAELPECSVSVGEDNDKYILKHAKEAALFVVGWGTKSPTPIRQNAVLDMLRSSGIIVQALGVNADGTPKHPSRLNDEIVPCAY